MPRKVAGRSEHAGNSCVCRCAANGVEGERPFGCAPASAIFIRATPYRAADPSSHVGPACGKKQMLLVACLHAPLRGGSLAVGIVTAKLRFPHRRGMVQQCDAAIAAIARTANGQLPARRRHLDAAPANGWRHGATSGERASCPRPNATGFISPDGPKEPRAEGHRSDTDAAVTKTTTPFASPCGDPDSIGGGKARLHTAALTGQDARPPSTMPGEQNSWLHVPLLHAARARQAWVTCRRFDQLVSILREVPPASPTVLARTLLAEAECEAQD